jgi:small neutral amino acid transporter SnatA (MarC family)
LKNLVSRLFKSLFLAQQQQVKKVSSKDLFFKWLGGYFGDLHLSSLESFGIALIEFRVASGVLLIIPSSKSPF